MFRCVRWVGSLCFVIAVVCGVTFVVADPPRILELPDIELPPVPNFSGDADSPVAKVIHRAVLGEFPDGEVGNPVLATVLEAIERDGSVLKGSSLDPDIEAIEIGEATEKSFGRNRSQGSSQRNAVAAEQLLKASRLLLETGQQETGQQNTGPVDSERQDLVNRMRAEAGKLLSE